MFSIMRKINGLFKEDMPLKPTSSALMEISQHSDRVRNCSYLGPSMHIEGNITVDENLRVEGKIEGTIRIVEKKLTVGKQAMVSGEINAGIAELHGKVESDVHSNDLVQIHSTAIVQGSIRCKRIVIEDGACFNGQVEMRQEKGKAATDESKAKSPSAEVVSIGK